MTQPARAASRSAAVLEFLTANPKRAFTLTELSDQLNVSIASLSAILQALLDVGFLIRHQRHKTYQLGPVLIAVGRAASVAHPVVELARPEMRRLAVMADAECIGSSVVGREIVLLAMEGKPSGRSSGLTVGQRVPLGPPFGQIFLAWGSAQAASEWWESAIDVKLSQKMREQLEAATTKVRERGYAINVYGDQVLRISEVMDELAHQPGNTKLRNKLVELMSNFGDSYQLLEQYPDEDHAVHQIIAPVFGPDGSVIFALTLIGIDKLRGQEILTVATELRAAAVSLTRKTGGKEPVNPVV